MINGGRWSGGDLGGARGHLVTQQTRILPLKTSAEAARIIVLPWPDLCKNPASEESKHHKRNPPPPLPPPRAPLLVK